MYIVISLVANKLGKNMLAFAEDFSYSQGNKNVLLSKVKIITYVRYSLAWVSKLKI